MKLGIVGLPNVGKSTLFNAITSTKNAEAANYPFCTIEPNSGIVAVPDKRLDKLAEIWQTNKKTPAIVEFVDIAGLVKGASQGAGLGNKFLGHIRECEDGVALVLTAGYQDADVRSAAYETQKQQYLEKGKTEEEAASLAADIQPPAECNDHGTGYAADILSTDYPTRDTGFDTTRAYEWLTAYAAEYGFILRYPQDRQAATGVVFEPWHWRYVGVENALAIRASGLSLEEFLAEQKAL